MTEPIEASHSPGFRTPDTNRSAIGRRVERLRERTERAMVPVAFVLVTVGLLAVGVLTVFGFAALLPSHPAVGVVGIIAVLAVGAAAPSLARRVLIRLAGQSER